MSIQKIRNIACAVMVGSLLIVSGQYMFAQNQPSPQEKSSDQGKSSTQEKGGDKKAKSSAESCDGALDIVPVKSMSFSRKRRQAKSESNVSADAKPDKSSDSKDDVKPNKPRQNEEKP